MRTELSRESRKLAVERSTGSGVANGNQHCYDRADRGQWSKVDSHLHFQPFGGQAIPYATVLDFLERLDVEYVNMYGIGQTLPHDAGCTYYLDCPGVLVSPTLQNDILNAAMHVRYGTAQVEVAVSMTFMDLTKPEGIVERIALLDQEFPGLYRWAGEANVVKQALFPNGHRAVTEAEIERWSGFMRVLERRKIPLAVHLDLGNDEEPTKYLHLIQKILETYPRNRIVWMHMGLSKELRAVDPDAHIEVMGTLSDQYPLLMFDLSWAVLFEYYFRYPEVRKKYVAFINAHYDRFLTGTDFVASADKGFADYRRALERTSYINQFLDDRAFRHIALGLNYHSLLGTERHVPSICGENVSDSATAP